MIFVGDFVLRHKKLNTGRLLPIEKVEADCGDFYMVSNRFNTSSTVLKTVIIQLDRQYEPIVWDELIQLEQKILFLMRCQRVPSNFRYLQGIGLVELTEKADTVKPQDEPWETHICNERVLQPLSEARTNQVESRLTEFEEQHDFLMEALESLG